MLAMNPGGDLPEIDGERVVEPAFGLPAKWIFKSDAERAELIGYTVVDPATVIATHLGEVLAGTADSLLGRKEFQELLALHERENKKVIEELIPEVLNHGQVIKVLRNLLMERVSIRDFRSILETLADYGPDIKDTEQLAELVRHRLSRQLTGQYGDAEGNVASIVLAPYVENVFRRMQNPATAGVVSPNELEQVMVMFREATGKLAPTAGVPALVVPADIRRTVAAFAVRHVSGLPVLSFREIDSRAEIITVGVVGGVENNSQIAGGM